MTARTLLGRSALGLGVYSLCIVFVFSFLLFEVLDVDGSDFPVTAAQALAAEAPHAEARRLHLDLVRDPIVPPIPVFEPAPAPYAIRPRVGHPAPVLPAAPVRHPVMLARVSLDAPPAA